MRLAIPIDQFQLTSGVTPESIAIHAEVQARLVPVFTKPDFPEELDLMEWFLYESEIVVVARGLSGVVYRAKALLTDDGSTRQPETWDIETLKATRKGTRP